MWMVYSADMNITSTTIDSNDAMEGAYMEDYDMHIVTLSEEQTR